MDGMIGTTNKLSATIAQYLPSVTGAINNRMGFTDRSIVPVPRTIFIDARARLQVDEHPSVMIVPQRMLGMQRTQGDASGDYYKCTYEIHVYVTTEIVESQERAAVQRQWMLLAMRECLLLHQEMGSEQGEAALDETSLNEIFGPVLGNWYAEGYLAIRVNTHETLERVPLLAAPWIGIVTVDLNMTQPYVP